MKYLLLSNYNHPKMLKEYINKNSKVIVLTFSNYKYTENHYDELWSRFHGREFRDVYNEYKKFGVPMKNIHILTSKDKDEIIEMCIEKADVVFLSGGNPNEFMEIANRNEGKIAKALQSKKNGIIIGSSAGAMVMCKQYYLYPYPLENTEEFEYNDGLNLLDDAVGLILVHYNEENEYMKEAINYCIEPIITIRDNEHILITKR